MTVVIMLSGGTKSRDVIGCSVTRNGKQVELEMRLPSFIQDPSKLSFCQRTYNGDIAFIMNAVY